MLFFPVEIPKTFFIIRSAFSTGFQYLVYIYTPVHSKCYITTVVVKYISSFFTKD